MELEKRIQLEKIYKKRRMVLKGIIVLLILTGMSYLCNSYIQERIYSNLNFVYFVLFYILQLQLAFLLRKIPPLLHNRPNFSGEKDFITLNKSIASGSTCTFILTGLFGIFSQSLIGLTVKSVCIIIMGALILFTLIAFLIYDKKERKKAKLEIENNSKK